MQTRREALVAGLSTVGALGIAGCVNLNTGEEETRPDDGTPDNEDSDLPPDYIDVREYGAVGDGQTDDSGAIQDAIEAAEPGETVFLPETEASYLLSFDKDVKHGDKAIQLSGNLGLDNVTVLGETPAEGAQTLQAEAGSYDKTKKNVILEIESDKIINGFKLKNLTIDGARPDGDQPAGMGGESSVLGFALSRGVGGGHDIVLEDVLVRNCSANGLRFTESGVSCRRVTSRGHGRHGFNPVAADTAVDPGFVGQSIKAVYCDGTGIDHRRGTARLTNVYTENNRQGNKWKHHIERLVVENHHSVDDQNHGWRSNHTASGDDYIPSQQNIIFSDIFIENAVGVGLRISGTATDITCDFENVEVRNTRSEWPENGAGVKILRDVEMINPGSGQLVVVGTRDGVGVHVYKSILNIGTYLHSDNEKGELLLNGDGEFLSKKQEKDDPGRNVFQTPDRSEVGAFV